MRTFAAVEHVIPAKDPGPCPVDADVRADRARKIREAEDVFLMIRRNPEAGTPVQRAQAGIGFPFLLASMHPDLLVEDAPNA
jgi:hypothetical protein